MKFFLQINILVFSLFFKKNYLVYTKMHSITVKKQSFEIGHNIPWITDLEALKTECHIQKDKVPPDL